MKRTVAFLLIFLLLPSIVFSHVEKKGRLIIPNIPENANQVETAIVILKEKTPQTDIGKIAKCYPNIKIQHIYEHAINGFSIQGPKKDIEELKKNYEVQHVTTAKKYQVTANKSIPFIGSGEVRGMYDDENNRLTGKGVTVGVIDTGIDYNHPDLTRNVAGGKDLVDDDDDPMETKIKEKFNTIHGTHVAGVIAANGRIRGVAPEATILAYRALGPNGVGTTEQILAAIDAAMEDKVDVLNLSLGNSINGPDLPISLAINKAVEQGIVAVTSNGNAGPHLWTVGSPGTAAKAISVGASTPPLKIPHLKLNTDTDRNMVLQPFADAERWELDRSYQVMDGGLGKKAELKHAKGKIVIIQRGEITFTEKAENAAKAGAVAAIIYNNTRGNFQGNLERQIPIPLASASKKDGKHILSQIKKQTEVYGQIKLMEEEDQLADFSSRGPVTVTWDIKPDVVAPGVGINSTIPGGYLSLQGTSMSAPHVSGAVALIKQAHPEWTPEQIKAALMNTAIRMKRNNGKDYRTYEQGAGRIQVAEAIKAESLVMPSSLRFGMFQLVDERKVHQAQLTVENTSNQRKNYSFSIPKKIPGVYWRLPQSFWLKPGEKKKVIVCLEIRASERKEKIHDGVITLHAGTQAIQIPFLYTIEEPNYPRVMGFEFKTGDGDVPYRYEVYLPGGADEFGIALFDPDDFTFVSFLDKKKNVAKGMLKEKLLASNLPRPGFYIAKVFAKKAGREDVVEIMLEIGENVEKE